MFNSANDLVKITKDEIKTNHILFVPDYIFASNKPVVEDSFALAKGFTYGELEDIVTVNDYVYKYLKFSNDAVFKLNLIYYPSLSKNGSCFNLSEIKRPNPASVNYFKIMLSEPDFDRKDNLSKVPNIGSLDNIKIKKEHGKEDIYLISISKELLSYFIHNQSYKGTLDFYKAIFTRVSDLNHGGNMGKTNLFIVLTEMIINNTQFWIKQNLCRN